jgi:putative chitinase
VRVPFAVVDRISGGDGERWHEPIADACASWDIDTAARIAMFLAQTAHESAGFRRLIESLKYSAAGLRRTWPQRFSATDAVDMAYDEVRIGERAYGGRMGNGPEGSGDGFAYRGRGLIQITGRANYVVMGEHLGADLTVEPELLTDPLWSAYAAACFWDLNGCSEAADADDFRRVTRIINGGENGMEDRLNWLAIVQEAMA